MLTDSQVEKIVSSLEKEAIGYSGSGSDIQNNRALLLDRYNRLPFGDEIDGQSQVITSDVFDTVEGMLPALLRLFLQNRQIAKFTANKEEAEEEAKAKTIFANWVFSTQHDPVSLLHSYVKDSLLQYTGTLKTYWDDKVEFVDGEDYEGLDEFQLQKLLMDENYSISDTEEVPSPQGDRMVYNVQGVRTNKTGKIKIEPIPPNEMVISKRAKDFTRPPFYGHLTPKTRSELIKMGFDKKKIKALGSGNNESEKVEDSRNYNLDGPVHQNKTTDKSLDIFLLGEYYLEIDRDQDGIAEYYQVFFISKENVLLEMTKIDNHGLATATSIPMPHRAIGECPASLVADHQYWSSTLTRQLNNNIYAGNFARVAANDRVDRDELLTPVPGGVVDVDGMNPVTGCMEPIPVINQVAGILQALEYANTQKETRTGVTSYNQGMDTESLNKTATGFQGVRDMSMMRVELIARILSEGIKKVFIRIIELASKYQNHKQQIMIAGKPVIIDPTSWKYNTDCMIDIGAGGGERQERIGNLNFMYEQMLRLKEMGSPLVDDVKLYNVLDKVTQVTGLNGATGYFNNPEVRDELLLAENEKLKIMVQQQQEIIEQNDQLTSVVKLEGENKLAEKQIDAQVKLIQEQNKMQKAEADRLLKDEHHDDKLMVELTRIEADTNKEVPGSAI